MRWLDVKWNYFEIIICERLQVSAKSGQVLEIIRLYSSKWLNIYYFNTSVKEVMY